MKIKKTAVFRFKDSTGKVFPISIDNPKEDLKLSEVNQFTSYVVDKDVFRPYDSRVVEFVGTEIVTVTRDALK
ncbi:hypothetical protein HMPREF9225_1984 [Peptoniphilus duerdenii ATCC BAA-1640]|uniref:DUF2922 domain-containing protein n=1 Tax=Peptoniphilus duerdenii ATCC BAA-1640 TaxID=862517 RepID=E0NP95_9FIRM|nr:DUF2922 domain-containing protein [Peptoniphilus duerdenii]EFM24388.1 hypothetical protein HMPREF9225_1984 [Peptoniphilus duerdenii ATCC BAA-1640]